MTKKHLLQQTIENPYQQFLITPEVTIIYLPIYVGGELLDGWEICKGTLCKTYLTPEEVLKKIEEYKKECEEKYL